MEQVIIDLDAATAQLGRARELLDDRAVVEGLDQLLGGDGYRCARVIDTTAAEIVWVAVGADGTRFEASSPVELVRAVDAAVLGGATPT